MNAIPVIYQKQKLLEMCKHFFPETNNWMDNYVVIHKQTCDICLKEYVLTGIFFKEYEEEDEMLEYITVSNGDRIHWFEFCMRYLTPKLDELYNKIILYPVDPYSEENKGKSLNYPKDWSERYQRRPFFQFNINCNASHYKKHPIDYLYEEFKKLTK